RAVKEAALFLDADDRETMYVEARQYAAAELEIRMQSIGLAQMHLQLPTTEERDMTAVARAHLNICTSYLLRRMPEQAASHANKACDNCTDMLLRLKFGKKTGDDASVDAQRTALQGMKMTAMLKNAEAHIRLGTVKGASEALGRLQEMHEGGPVELREEGHPSRIGMLLVRADVHYALALDAMNRSRSIVCLRSRGTVAAR
ncbi:hypothetical protein CYMTET_33592, partial [Cymbomonas tetramitiformis]